MWNQVGEEDDASSIVTQPPIIYVAEEDDFPIATQPPPTKSMSTLPEVHVQPPPTKSMSTLSEVHETPAPVARTIITPECNGENSVDELVTAMLGLGVSPKPIDREELASILKLPSYDESLNNSVKQSCVANDAVQAKKAPPRAKQPSDGAKQPSGKAKKTVSKPSKTKKKAVTQPRVKSDCASREEPALNRVQQNQDAWKDGKADKPSKRWMSQLLRVGKIGPEQLETKEGLRKVVKQFEAEFHPDDVTFSEETKEWSISRRTTTDDESSNERVKTAEDKQSKTNGKDDRESGGTAGEMLAEQRQGEVPTYDLILPLDNQTATQRKQSLEKMYKKGNNIIRSLHGAAFVGAGHYGQLRRGGSKAILEALENVGAIDNDTKVLDLGGGSFMWCLHMSLMTGKRVMGVEKIEDRLLMACSILNALFKIDSTEGGLPRSLYQVGIFDADISEMTSLLGATVLYCFCSAFEPALREHVTKLFLDSTTCKWFVAFAAGCASPRAVKNMVREAKARGIKIEKVATVPAQMQGSGTGHTAFIFKKSGIDTKTPSLLISKSKLEEDVDNFYLLTKKAEVVRKYNGMEAKLRTLKPMRSEVVRAYEVMEEKQRTLKAKKAKRSKKKPPTSTKKPPTSTRSPSPPWWAGQRFIMLAQDTDLYESTEPVQAWLRDNWGVTNVDQAQSAPSKFAMVEPIATIFGESPDDIYVTPFKHMEAGESHPFGWERGRFNVCVYILFGNPVFHGNPDIVQLQPGRVVFMASIPDTSFSLEGDCTFCAYIWPPISARLYRD
jgi:hypothetical protein